MLRTSSYSIIIKLKDNSFALAHGYSGAIDKVSREIGEALLSGKSVFPIDMINEDEVKVLQERGYLTNLTCEEEENYFLRVADLENKKLEVSCKYIFTLIITYGCNFSCPYCFERDLFKNATKRNKVISKQQIDSFFQCIQEIQPNNNQILRQIMLFGGEPLLKDNYDIIAYIVTEGIKRNFAFTATSNGYDLNHYSNLLGKNKINSIQITLDGPSYIHNKRRGHSTFKDSFERIISNIRMALQKDVMIRVRVNVDSENHTYISDLYRVLEREGFLKNNNFSIYLEFISSDVNFNPDCYTPNDNDNYRRIDYINQFSGKEFEENIDNRVYSNVIKAIKFKRRLSLTPKHCSAQMGSYIFDPFYNIYSCYEEIGKPEMRIGHYEDGLKWNLENREKWHNRNITKYVRCSKCKYGLICGGGCFSKEIISDKGYSYCDDFPLKFNSILKKIIENQ